MTKRYQVFISSTYEDLKEARQEVMQALLELDCIPAGMELFPAANEDQWTLIKTVIDDCDYYMVIVGGRYGSLGPEGISYTRMEYEYAVSKNKPLIAFLHQEPENLPSKFVEKTEEGRQKLQDFRALVQRRMCKFWKTPADLGSVVSRSLVKLIKVHPAVGWVRADLLPDGSTVAEMLRLRKKVDLLEGELQNLRTTPPKGIEELMQGSDPFDIDFDGNIYDKWHKAILSTTWDEIFWSISPLFFSQASTTDIMNALHDFIEHRPKQVKILVKDGLPVPLAADEHLRLIRPDTASLHTILVQLRAIGLIDKSAVQEGAGSHDARWVLTPYGESVMNKMRALRKVQGVAV